MNENKTPVPRHIIFIIFLALLMAIALVGKIAYGLAGISVYDACNQSQSCDLYNIKVPTPVLTDGIEWTQEMENKRLEALKPKKVEKPMPKVEKKQETIKEVKIDTSFDLDKLAKAVAMAETGNCTEGYGVSHNNCHGIKSGNTYKCPGTPKGKMCKFKDKEESFIAFKVIWGKWYKTMPNLRTAKLWTGDDKKVSWLYNVNHHYEKLQ